MDDSGSRFQVRSKIWLEVNGEPVFGQGREELFRRIQQTGSIHAAALAMDMPYRKAWTYIDSMEKRIGLPLVKRNKGGSVGGGSSLTPEAMDLMGKFDLLRKGFDDIVNRKFIKLNF